MGASSLNNLPGGYLQSLLAELENAASTANPATTSSANAAASVNAPSDQQQLSPFARIVTALQQLQQSNPAEYQQVTRQIAANLQTAAQTARSDGNTSQANQLNQLVADFSNASSSGQLPNFTDLAQSIGGHHHHHHHSGSDSPDSQSSSGAADSGSSSNSALSQALSAFGNTGSGDSLNPASIILNTLTAVGVDNSNS